MSYELRPAPKPKSRRRKRSTGLQRTRMKKRGLRTKKSHGALFPKNVDEPYRNWIRSLHCILAGRMLAPGTIHLCTSPTQVCHVKSRGAVRLPDTFVERAIQVAHGLKEPIADHAVILTAFEASAIRRGLAHAAAPTESRNEP